MMMMMMTTATVYTGRQRVTGGYGVSKMRARVREGGGAQSEFHRRESHFCPGLATAWPFLPEISV